MVGLTGFRYCLLAHRKNHHGVRCSGSERSYRVFLCSLLALQTSQSSGNVVVVLHFLIPQTMYRRPKVRPVIVFLSFLIVFAFSKIFFPLL